MPKRGKKYLDAVKRFNRQQAYAPKEALDLVQSLAHASFDETVEMAVRLGVDPRRADQVVRGTVALPSGTGKTVRVAVFAAGEAADAARAAGAEFVGSDDLVSRVDGGFMDFDVAIASPDMMGKVGRLGRKLG
ncbi:MAG: 50S ribosomal protein L1, partial [Actinomycetota bacterium]|nr:50S ribosomal protein L1 [Actinomycetota bacterium]